MDTLDKFRCRTCGCTLPLGDGRQKYCTDCKLEANKLHSLEKYHVGKGHSVIDTQQRYDMRKQPCIRCGFRLAIVLHDITPVYDGGNRKDSANIIPLCPNCHVTLHKNTWRIWEIEDKLKDYSNYDYSAQYWLIQILKSENFRYTYKRNSPLSSYLQNLQKFHLPTKGPENPFVDLIKEKGFDKNFNFST